MVLKIRLPSTLLFADGQSDLKSEQSGFSLLECIISLVILSFGCLAYFSWINNLSSQTLKYNLYIESYEVIASAISMLKSKDFDKELNGKYSSGEINVFWEAKELDSSIQNVNNEKKFKIKLYEIKLKTQKGKVEIPELRTKIIKYKNLLENENKNK